VECGGRATHPLLYSGLERSRPCLHALGLGPVQLRPTFLHASLLHCSALFAVFPQHSIVWRLRRREAHKTHDTGMQGENKRRAHSAA
jgi:hypothetical protein